LLERQLFDRECSPLIAGRNTGPLAAKMNAIDVVARLSFCTTMVLH